MQLSIEYGGNKTTKLLWIGPHLAPRKITARKELTNCSWEYKMAQLLWRMVWQLLKMLSIGYYPASPLLGTDPKELKTCPHKNLYPGVHSSNVLESRNNPRAHPLKDE